MPERKRYTGPEITVTYDAARCLHAAECVRGLPAVFDTAQRPWIRADQAPAEAVAAVVRRCPTGALRYEATGVEPETWNGPTVVTAVPDGPLELRGSLQIAGEPETRAALCRCGLTANGLFCDHACRRAGWHSR